MEQVPTQRETVRLEYSTAALAMLRRPRWLGWVTVVVALVAVCSCFMPFTKVSTSTPWVEAHQVASFPDQNWEFGIKPIVLVGLGFMTAIPIALWKVRCLFRQRPGKWEQRAGVGIAILSAMPLAILLLILVRHVMENVRSGSPYHSLLTGPSGAAIFAVVVLLVSVLLAVRFMRNGDPATAVEVLLMSPFIANTALPLEAFRGYRSIGWWLTLFVAIAWLAEWAILWRLSRRSGTQIAT